MSDPEPYITAHPFEPKWDVPFGPEDPRADFCGVQLQTAGGGTRHCGAPAAHHLRYWRRLSRHVFASFDGTPGFRKRLP